MRRSSSGAADVRFVLKTKGIMFYGVHMVLPISMVVLHCFTLQLSYCTVRDFCVFLIKCTVSKTCSMFDYVVNKFMGMKQTTDPGVKLSSVPRILNANKVENILPDNGSFVISNLNECNMSIALNGHSNTQ